MAELATVLQQRRWSRETGTGVSEAEPTYEPIPER